MNQNCSKIEIERAKVAVLKLITQCIKDIENTVSDSDLSMRDVGVEVARYATAGDSCIVELKVFM
jgi:hypothetical protein